MLREHSSFLFIFLIVVITTAMAVLCFHRVIHISRADFCTLTFSTNFFLEAVLVVSALLLRKGSTTFTLKGILCIAAFIS